MTKVGVTVEESEPEPPNATHRQGRAEKDAAVAA
jgi:hypothetical protein